MIADVDVAPASRVAPLGSPPWVRYLTLFIVFAAVNWLIFAPATSFREVKRWAAHQDKIAHAVIFLSLACVSRWSLLREKTPGERNGLLRFLLPALLLLYACSAELLQPVIGGKGRHFEWWDMASNAAGLTCGWLLYGAVVARLRGTPTAPLPA